MSRIKAIQVTSSIFLHHHQYIFYKFSHLLVVIASCHLYNRFHHFNDLLFTKMNQETLTYPKSNISLSSIITSTLYKLTFINQYDQLTQTRRKIYLQSQDPYWFQNISIFEMKELVILYTSNTFIWYCNIYHSDSITLSILHLSLII